MIKATPEREREEHRHLRSHSSNQASQPANQPTKLFCSLRMESAALSVVSKIGQVLVDELQDIRGVGNVSLKLLSS